MYEIAFATSRFDMEEAVKNKLTKGWRLAGSLQVVCHASLWYFYQPITKDDLSENTVNNFTAACQNGFSR